MASNLNSAVDNQYFYEDEVFKINKRGFVQFGLILENSETSLFSDSEDEMVKSGQIRIAWYPSGKEEIVNEKFVGLADRTLMPGDVVRRCLEPGKDTQRGYCREINMRADLKIVGTKYVIKNVMAERLRPLVKIPRDNAVCLDSWVGSTRCVNEKVILKSSCGAIIEVSDLDLCTLKDKNAKFRNGLFADTVFYPGQIVTGRLESLDKVKLLTPSIILRTNKKGKPIARKFVVQSVQVDGIWVHWQCKALSEDGELQANMLEQPNPYVTGEDLNKLKYLNLFESCMLQINDKNYLKITDCDVIIKKSQWEKEQAIKYKLIWSQHPKEENQSNNKSTKAATKSNSDKIKIKLTDVDTNSKKLRVQLSKLAQQNSVSVEDEKITVDTEGNKISITNIERNETEDGGKLKPIFEEWQTTDDEEDFNFEDDDSAKSESTISTISSSPTPKSSPKRSPLLQKKQMKKIRKNSREKSPSSEKAKMPNLGDEIVTEALVVYSTATVVWQDGTIETNIPSTQLYPIHHLDDHEFFPGDFVLSATNTSDSSFRDYGVIQKVDHMGRTAHVKWFRTYASTDEPKPEKTGESEVSVYDLKDHPDFQYRPGTIVIRVANFVGEDSSCTAGQIVDNYIDGRVKVWWVDGHISMCWPQDLFEVGQYDADNNFFGNNDDSENDSWETESEISEPGGTDKNEHAQLSVSLERARVAMSRLEEIFNLNPNLQNQDVMHQLLVLYKKCRYLDRLMSTSFFHEDNFMGLLERVKKCGNHSKAEQAQEQKNRLFNSTNSNHNASGVSDLDDSLSTIDFVTLPSKEYSPKVILNLSSTPFKYSFLKKKSSRLDLNNTQQPASQIEESNLEKLENVEKSSHNLSKCIVSASRHSGQQQSIIFFDGNNTKTLTTPNDSKISNEKNKLLSSVMSHIEKATQETEKSTQFKLLKTTGSQQSQDSGNYSHNQYDGCSSTSYASSSDLTVDLPQVNLLKANDDQKSVSCSSIEFAEDTPDYVCRHFCSLLKCQLIKALHEIQQKYCKKSLNLSDVIEYSFPEENETNEDYELEKTNEVISKEGEEDDVNCKEDDDGTHLVKSSTIETLVKEITSPSVDSKFIVSSESFKILDHAPSTHKFSLTIFHPSSSYYKAVCKEHNLLKTSLPQGVWVRVFEDRMDLISVMIEGPSNTPYEEGMFFFDIQLGRDYPRSPPVCHYLSYCCDRLNPNLYEDGKVCVSLLGTWSGRLDSEVWGPKSTLLQVIVSIQGLILVAEPYFNEAGYEKQKGTQQGSENSRMYNEMVVIKLVQSMTKLLSSPPEIFKEQIIEHFSQCKIYSRIKKWMDYSSKHSPTCGEGSTEIDETTTNLPEFPLLPASRGWRITLTNLLEILKGKIDAISASSQKNHNINV